MPLHVFAYLSLAMFDQHIMVVWRTNEMILDPLESSKIVNKLCSLNSKSCNNNSVLKWSMSLPYMLHKILKVHVCAFDILFSCTCLDNFNN